MDGWMDGCDWIEMDAWMDGWMDGIGQRWNGWMDGWDEMGQDGWMRWDRMDGWDLIDMDGWMDGWMEKRRLFTNILFVNCYYIYTTYCLD